MKSILIAKKIDDTGYFIGQLNNGKWTVFNECTNYIMAIRCARNICFTHNIRKLYMAKDKLARNKLENTELEEIEIWR